MAVCSSITKLKEVAGMDLLKVNVEEADGSLTVAYWFYDYAKALEYVGQEVIVDYRMERIDGENRPTINTFTVPTMINTLQHQDNIKLYCDAEDNFSNFSFNDIQEGEQYTDAIMYCVDQEFESSERAVWVTFTVRDKLMHCAKLRLFDYNNTNMELAGHYIIADVRKTKYGLQAEAVALKQGDVQINPEITIAKKFVQNYFANDATALRIISMFKLLEHFDNAIDYERGYGVVRLATELSLAHELHNITKDINVKTVEHAILGSFLYITQPNSILSNTVKNCMLAMKVDWDDKKGVIRILDEASDDKTKEYMVYKHIKSLANVIIEERKGVTNL